MVYKKIMTPIGELTLVADENALSAILFAAGKMSAAKFLEAACIGDNQILQETEKQLNEYFAGKRKLFDLALNPRGTTFQKAVWRELANIPYGVTKSYSEIAKQMGAPKATRAIGGANAKNPIPILVPCHRVIGANASLTGFSGGLSAKTFLLELERPKGT